jgi:5-methylcytosine-specific restriction endonuclease McrA
VTRGRDRKSLEQIVAKHKERLSLRFPKAIHKRNVSKPPSKGSLRAVTYREQEGFCAYCGNVTLWEDWTVDHVDPRSKGGQNHYSNARGSCATCNRSKGDKHIDDWSPPMPVITRIISCRTPDAATEELFNHINP